MKRKGRKRITALLRPAAAAFVVIVILLLMYLLPEFPGRLWSSFELVDPETTEDVDLSPEEDAEDDPIDKAEEAADPFEEREDEEEPGEDRERERAEENTVETPEAEPAEVEEDLKVISDGDYLLALVTKETTLKRSYEPVDLEAIPSHMNPSYPMRLRSDALRQLEKLWEAAQEDGIILSIRSAYRSYETQKQLFKDYVSRHGEEEANRFSARPGQSEHQLGTAVDFGGTEADFTERFGQTEQGRWLAENAHKYGFVKSYPQGKEQVTGYIYEPWHFRYIGVEHAREWKESGLTLTEYLKQQPQSFE